jgi:hypothetical protein
MATKLPLQAVSQNPYDCGQDMFGLDLSIMLSPPNPRKTPHQQRNATGNHINTLCPEKNEGEAA